jgi:cytochrome c-type biogenesis protein CcmH/NrfG
MMMNDAPISSDSLQSALQDAMKVDSEAFTDDQSQVSEAKSETAILSKKETRQILWSKVLVVLVITLAAFATSTGVYVLVKNSEDADFQVRVSTVVHGL